MRARAVRFRPPFRAIARRTSQVRFEKLADVLDDLHEFVQRVALPAGEDD